MHIHGASLSPHGQQGSTSKTSGTAWASTNAVQSASITHLFLNDMIRSLVTVSCRIETLQSAMDLLRAFQCVTSGRGVVVSRRKSREIVQKVERD